MRANEQNVNFCQVMPMKLVLAILLLALPACRVTDMTLWGPGEPRSDGCEIERINDVPYTCNADPNDRDHQLDLFLPKGVKGYPVAVFVHGGTWVMGDNRCCGLHSSIGEFLARHGIGAILPNYRLSPGVKHPEHVKDVAAAVAWTRDHIGEFGGDVNHLFLVGHSAGGHLVSLLTTDEQYLKAEGMHTSDIKGVVSISGVYDIPPGSPDVTIGGSTRRSLRFEQFAPLRGDLPPWHRLALTPGIPISVNVFHPAFGDDPDVRATASPIHYVRPGLPPFLLCYAEEDLPLLSCMAKDFHQALQENGCDSTLLQIENRNHNSIAYRAISAHDPVGAAMLDFISKHTSK
jgi:acetyl esterase/lipase